MMHCDVRTLTSVAAAALLAGCASLSNAGPPIELSGAQASLRALAEKTPPSGLYVSTYYGALVYGYPAENPSNGPPVCTIEGVSETNDVAVDGKGNLIDPDGGSNSIVLFKGPTMCGARIGSIADSYGQPSDASSFDAVTGKIAVSNIFDTAGGDGSVAVCTLHGGCTENLTNHDLYEAGGVAMNRDGDCWVSAKKNAGGSAALIYFHLCSGAGHAATGFQNRHYGGLDIDKAGNLVAIDQLSEQVYVYENCHPKCRLAGGPFKLRGDGFFGKLNAESTHYAVADITRGTIDVYDYAVTKMTFLYSFDNGLSPSQAVEGVAFNPPSKQ